ncbi:hypothetical protein Lal_00035237 [Lupinus albus]|nr:hypothetical protein Lal_00035237 [Lupinus albus]
MEKTIENIHSNFNSIRTDKSNSAMLDKIEVEYYGSPVNLKSIAQISTPNANSILVQPYYKSSDECPTFQQPSLSNGEKGNSDVNDSQQLKSVSA